MAHWMMAPWLRLLETEKLLSKPIFLSLLMKSKVIFICFSFFVFANYLITFLTQAELIREYLYSVVGPAVNRRFPFKSPSTVLK